MRSLDKLVQAYQTGNAAAQQELLERIEGQLRPILRARMGPFVRTERESMDRERGSRERGVKAAKLPVLDFRISANDGRIEWEK